MTGFSPLKSCSHSYTPVTGHPGVWKMAFPIVRSGTSRYICGMGNDLQAHLQKHDYKNIMIKPL